MVALAGVEDVDRAVRATKAAFSAFSTTRKQERIDLLERIIDLFAVREDVLVHESQIDQVVAFLQAEVNSVGRRSAGFKVHYGPVINKAQFDRVQHYIHVGSEEGARLN